MLLHIPNFRRLYGSNACVRAIVGHLAAAGTPARKETVVAQMWKELRGQAYTFSRPQVIQAFKSLQHVGAGTFIVGRKQYPTRFHHAVDAATLAKAARTEGEGVPQAESSAAAADGPAIIDHRYVLRQDFHVTVRLPANLTKTEATRLAEFLRTLPFE